MNQNAAIHFVDRHVAEGRGEKTVFIEADGAQRTMSYGALSEASAVFAGALAAHDIRREERIAMIVLDQVEFPTIFFGALKAGVVPIPINTLLSTQVYTEILNDSRATALFVSAALWPAVAPAAAASPCLRHVVVIGEAPEGTTPIEQFVAEAAPRAPVEVSGDEIAFWLYSSGSTGTPKGVRHVHSSMQATADTFGAKVLGIREDDVVYSVAKFFFAYGLGNSISFPLSVGATAVICAGRPTPDAALTVIAEQRPTIFCAVPTLFAALDAAIEAKGAPEHWLRLCTSAGEALPREVGERWQAEMRAPIIDGVGSTELLHIFLSNAPNDILYGTSGKAVPGYELRLVDEHGEEVGPGEVGELLVKAPSAADGYWNRRDKTRTTFEGEWTRTGDKYERSAEGRYVYCGRTDDMFKVSGIWVSPFEVEQALIEHPSVLEAAVVARADADGLLKPAAYIVAREGATPDPEALKHHVQERIGKWKYPRWIEVVDDLPKTATGKIQRFKLRG